MYVYDILSELLQGYTRFKAHHGMKTDGNFMFHVHQNMIFGVCVKKLFKESIFLLLLLYCDRVFLKTVESHTVGP